VTAGLKLRQILSNVESILAIELMCAAQGIDFRRQAIGKDKKLGNGTRDIYQRIRDRVPFIEKDQLLYRHLEEVRSLIASEKL
jgi:histidine ammonia-lyase